MGLMSSEKARLHVDHADPKTKILTVTSLYSFIATMVS